MFSFRSQSRLRSPRLLALWLLAVACVIGCGDSDVSTGGGVIITTTPAVDEPVEVGAVGAGLPFGFIQKGACRMTATVEPGLLTDQQETLSAVLRFAETGRVREIEQRFFDTRSSDLSIRNTVIDLSYEAMEPSRLDRIFETDTDSGTTVDSEISYQGATSRITRVRSTTVAGDLETTSVNSSRKYNEFDRVSRYEDVFDGQPILFGYEYDFDRRLSKVGFSFVDAFLPIPLAALHYDDEGRMNRIDFPSFQLCTRISYDDDGFATDSLIQSCDGSSDEISVSFDGCNDKAVAFWVMYTLNAY